MSDKSFGHNVAWLLSQCYKLWHQPKLLEVLGAAPTEFKLVRLCYMNHDKAFVRSLGIQQHHCSNNCDQFVRQLNLNLHSITAVNCLGKEKKMWKQVFLFMVVLYVKGECPVEDISLAPRPYISKFSLLCCVVLSINLQLT